MLEIRTFRCTISSWKPTVFGKTEMFCIVVFFFPEVISTISEVILYFEETQESTPNNISDVNNN